MKAEKISELTTNRLSVYLRCLNELSAEGEKTVSSGGLAKRFHLNSAQIRKDLANFGEFGVRGVGYDIDRLREHLIRILGLNKKHRVGILGAGRLGTALADYYRLNQTNFEIAGLFDADPELIGKKLGSIQIFDIKDFPSAVKRDNIKVAVIAVPARSAQDLLDLAAGAGIRAVMSFAPIPLRSADHIKLKTVDLTTCLDSLAYHLAGFENPDGREVKPSPKKRRK